MKKQSPEEMTRRINEIWEQVYIYRECRSCGELLVAVSNLFGLLYYDFGVEFPPTIPPREADFEF